MSIADLKGQAVRLFDSLNTHDAGTVARCCAADARLRDVALSEQMIGTDQIAALFARYLTALPDASIHIERLVGEGHTVVVEWIVTGTHKGLLMGIPPTGKMVTFTGVSIISYRGDLISCAMTIWDFAGVLRQIGLLPSQE
jgi:steroid delta-isomerase-like uncharacterized protein